VGPPGTAKSDLVLKFKDALKLGERDYFEYMLTRFTEPSEVLGPIDINLLRQGRYIRRDRGKLPTARLVFLDEIFKSNSAILNSLLTIINERKFYQDGQPVPVRLKILFAATNEIPEHAELAALKDRFCLKAACRSVQDEHFIELIDAGLDAQTGRSSCASSVASSRRWCARTTSSSPTARSSSSTASSAPAPGSSTAAPSSARTSRCSPTSARPAKRSTSSKTRSRDCSAWPELGSRDSK
jgi:hypothetical protein